LLMQLELKRSDDTGAKARRESSKAPADVRSQAQGALMEVAWSGFGTVLERRLEGNAAKASANVLHKIRCQQKTARVACLF
jgi:hypothetical protein